ncbi:MAG TPA: RNA-binding domain-containing protein, partial [Chloroflexia bacterium]|nr:RNA-binding domain-containing protein [Chloroflexia bacterium]
MDRRNSWRRGDSPNARTRIPGRTPRPYISQATRALEEDREVARNRPAPEGMYWKRMDLHLHTPASSDYRDPGISYLDILKKAEDKGLDMIAFTDHNSIGGYAAMHREIETLTLLERLNRLTPEERATLDEYRRLLGKIVVLPGFEFTATFGFHILGIFPENTSVRKLEHLLLNLNVPEEKMVMGAPDAGSTSDVLTAYQTITAAGGLAIAAHANSSNGVAMQGFPFGGQTKIAYTQDPNLVALEVTDLESLGRRNTPSFYNGSKTEYPRRMHCIQGSDAHSLDTEQSDSNNKRLGVGARITEILVRETSFAALKELLTSDDFTRTRPFRSNLFWEQIDSARMEGASLIQSFHERAITRTSRTRPILHDVIAFANADGGTIYVGANPDTSVPIHGLEHHEEDVRILREDVLRTIDPPHTVEFEVRKNGERGVIVINVPEGNAKPYIFAPTGQIYVRHENESTLANRDDIVRLVLESLKADGVQVPDMPARPVPFVAAESAQASAGPVPSTAEPRPPRDDRASRDYQRPSSAFTRPAQPAESSQQPPAREQRPQPVMPTPPLAPPRTARHPLLANLPPEKIKGQVQPMFRRAEELTTTPTLQPVGQGVADANVETEAPTASEVVAQAEDVTAAPVEPVAEEVQPKKPARGRPRRKPAAEETPIEAVISGDSATTAIVETAEPMEATVAAEHKTREELVAAAPEPEQPARGKRRSRSKKLEVDAPTAAAASSDAGTEAILVAAEVEPGLQIPAELEAAEAVPTEKKGRSRRKTAAQKAAEEAAAQAEAAPTAVEEAAPVEEPPPAAKGRGRGRSRKKSDAAAPVAATLPVEPPDPPSNGVEIISTATRDGTQYHTMRDLRNASTVHNVTRKSARRLWHYAILQHEHGSPALSEVLWHPELPIGLWRQGNRAGALRYDLVSRYPDGSTRIFYGVT